MILNLISTFIAFFVFYKFIHGSIMICIYNIYSLRSLRRIKFICAIASVLISLIVFQSGMVSYDFIANYYNNNMFDIIIMYIGTILFAAFLILPISSVLSYIISIEHERRRKNIILRRKNK